MSWLKIDDQIPRHHKIVRIDPGAAWLWVCSIAYAQNHYTDGFISTVVIGHLGPPKHIASKLLKQLLEVGLWERVEGGYQVHDYLKHNASAAHRKREARVRARAGRIGGQTTQTRRRARLNEQANVKHHGKQAASSKSSTLRTPLHSDPLHSDPIEAGAPTARPADRNNTAGNGSRPSGRVAADAAGGRASAPVDRPAVDDDETSDEARELLADARREAQKRGH